MFQARQGPRSPVHRIFALLVKLDDEIDDFEVCSPSLDWKHLKDKDQAFFVIVNTDLAQSLAHRG